MSIWQETSGTVKFSTSKLASNTNIKRLITECGFSEGVSSVTPVPYDKAQMMWNVVITSTDDAMTFMKLMQKLVNALRETDKHVIIDFSTTVRYGAYL